MKNFFLLNAYNVDLKITKHSYIKISKLTLFAIVLQHEPKMLSRDRKNKKTEPGLVFRTVSKCWVFKLALGLT